MFRFLLEKEFKQVMRQTIIVRLIVIMPVMMLLILPWAANMDIKNINLTVVDNDHSSYSSRLAAKSSASGYFRLISHESSYDDAMSRQVQPGHADVVLEIPHGFERDIVKTGAGRISVSVNTVNATKGALGGSYMGMIASDFAAEINAENGTTTAQPSIEIVPRSRFNQTMDYHFYMVPALMMMLLTLLCGFIPAIGLVMEKEIGTIEQINVTPVSPLKFILAKLIPYWTIGYLALTIAFILARLVYGLSPAGSLLSLYAAATVYIFCISGLGLLISNFASNMQQAMFIMMFFVVIFMLMSGLFTPISSMPQWAQTATLFNPLRYFGEAMRMIYLKGSSIADLTRQMWAMAGFAVFFNLVSILTYKKHS